MADLTGTRLLGYFEARRAAHKTFNNRRGVVSSFLRFALQRDWIADNPLSKIPPRRIRRRRGCAVPFFALCMFAGIRPCLRTGEILRLQPSRFKLEANLIPIDGVREPRNFAIQPNLAAWLQANPLKKFPIIPANLQHIEEKVAKKFPLSHDIMRRTFISMFVAKFRSIGEASLQGGNSEGIIRKHYLDLKTTEEAELFFGILPTRSSPAASDSAAEPVIPLLPVPTSLHASTVA